MFSYDEVSVLFDFWGVMAEKAVVECEVANHRASCIMARVEEVLNEHHR